MVGHVPSRQAPNSVASGGSVAGVGIVAAALAAVFIAALDLTVISTLLPAIIVDLDIPITQFDQAAWIVTAYVLAYTVAIPLAGRASDVFGRWPVLVVALALFGLGSLACATVDSLARLVIGRAVQAVGDGAGDDGARR